MFKLLSVYQTPKAQPKASNHFNSYAVFMPAQLIEVLQKRVYTVLLHKFYGIDIPHDLSINHLIELDDFLLSQREDDAHNLIVDSLQLELLKRFVKQERSIINLTKLQLVPALTNNEYWTRSGELLESMIRPTQLVPLSLFP